MTSINVSALIAGKSLKNAILSHGKAVKTMSERDHLLAASALNHLADHGGCEHIQSLYDLTPTNYRPALRKWATAFGRCKFDEKTLKFEYVKGKKGNIEGALAISPAEFEKASKAGGKADAAYDYVKPFTGMITRAESLLEEFDKQNVPQAVQTALEVLRDAMKRAESAATKFRIAAAKPAVVVDNTKNASAPKAAKPAKAKPETKTAPEGVAA